MTNISTEMNRFKCLSVLKNNITERKNKKLMIDKILSYSPMICEGVDKYNDANRNFWLLIFLGGILKDFLMISLPCCLLAMFFIIRMFQFIKYKSIHTMVKELAKDLLFKGIYNKNKAERMLCEFENKYGVGTKEYIEFYTMLNKYEQLVIKIEYLLKNINEKTNCDEAAVSETDFDNNTCNSTKVTEDTESKKAYIDVNGNKSAHRFNNVKSIESKSAHKNELKNIRKAIELFGNNDDGNDTEKAILLKNRRDEDKNLKVYLYKKSVDCQKNIL